MTKIGLVLHVDVIPSLSLLMNFGWFLTSYHHYWQFEVIPKCY